MNRSKIRITYIDRKGANCTEFGRDEPDADAKIVRLKAQGGHTFRKYRDAGEPERTEEAAPVSDTAPFIATPAFDVFIGSDPAPEPTPDPSPSYDAPDTSSPDTSTDYSGGGGDFGGGGSSGEY